MSKQQQTLEYFRLHAHAWRDRAEGRTSDKVNVVKQRNDYVLRVINVCTNVMSTLDVGCGTGELVCAIAQLGINATGVDFAPEMIELAKSKAKALRIGSAEFTCASIFDLESSAGKYSLVSANGFIEYLSLDEIDRFFSLVLELLKPSGSLVLGSRNRLFNLYSMNEFTRHEVDMGQIYKILGEALVFTQATDIPDLLNGLREYNKSEPIAPENALPSVGVPVRNRHQFTPAQLLQKLETRGFTVVDVAPIHIHGAGTVFKDRLPGVHVAVADLLQTYVGENFWLVPQSSSFMLHAIRES